MKNNEVLTYGSIVRVTVKGQNFPTMITVQYEVGGQSYEISESLKLKNLPIKVGFLPIGQKKVPILGNIAVGNKVKVAYEPTTPERAYLPDNIGKANI